MFYDVKCADLFMKIFNVCKCVEMGIFLWIVSCRVKWFCHLLIECCDTQDTQVLNEIIFWSESFWNVKWAVLSKKGPFKSILVVKYKLKRRIHQNIHCCKNISVNQIRHLTLEIGDHVFFTSVSHFSLWRYQTLSLRLEPFLLKTAQIILPFPRAMYQCPHGSLWCIL
jgi:hypothetical protein